MFPKIVLIINDFINKTQKMNRQIQIETCYAGHDRCIVCKRRKGSDRSLRLILQSSISKALVHYNILIPVGVRVCLRHF
jgi:hypothetical protein